MNTTDQLTRIFCEIDDFCKELKQYTQQKLLPGPVAKTERGPKCKLAMSEIMTILVMFHQIRFRDFKTFYTGYVQRLWKLEFPGLPTYERFVDLIKKSLFPMALFTHLKSGQRTGIYYIDSTCLPVCHLKRSKQHKVFDEIAEYGKTSVGWFFGLKLHLVTNDKGQLIAFKITQGSRSDSTQAESLLSQLEGLAFGDKGYISQKLFNQLLTKGLKLITRKRKNMEALQINAYEQQLLNQRNLIETVIDHLKHHYQVWHTRHRSILNAMTHLVSALAAYALYPLSLSAIKLLTNC